MILTFDEDTDDYFARQLVFQRLSEVTYPTDVTPLRSAFQSLRSCISLCDRKPRPHPEELKTYEDWVIEREYKQVPGWRMIPASAGR